MTSVKADDAVSRESESRLHISNAKATEAGSL